MANTAKIYGGEEAMPHEYPWNVYVSMKKNGEWYLCTGSLISRQHVLMAAHCVDEGQLKEDVSVRIGKVDLISYI